MKLIKFDIYKKMVIENTEQRLHSLDFGLLYISYYHKSKIIWFDLLSEK